MGCFLHQTVASSSDPSVEQEGLDDPEGFAQGRTANDEGEEVFDSSGACALGCPNHWKGDADCDEECNVASCDFDGGDCVADSSDALEALDVANNSTNSSVVEEACNARCPGHRIGDQDCDEECNTASCDWDGGDCDSSAAP